MDDVSDSSALIDACSLLSFTPAAALRNRCRLACRDLICMGTVKNTKPYTLLSFSVYVKLQGLIKCTFLCFQDSTPTSTARASCSPTSFLEYTLTRWLSALLQHTMKHSVSAVASVLQTSATRQGLAHPYHLASSAAASASGVEPSLNTPGEFVTIEQSLYCSTARFGAQRCRIGHELGC